MDLIEKLKKEVGISKDYIFKSFFIDKRDVTIFFNEVLTSADMINEFILKRLVSLRKKDLNNLENKIPDRNILLIKETDILNYVHNGYIIIIF